MADDSEFAFQLQLTEVLAASYVTAGLAERPHMPAAEVPPVKADEPVKAGRTRAGPKHSIRKRKSRDLAGVKTTEEKEAVSQICGICLEGKPSRNFLLLEGCGHKFCADCTAQHVRVKVESAQVPVTCPEPGCPASICSEECQDLQLPMAVLDSMAKLEAVASIPEADRVYCPFPDCSALMTKPQRIRAQPSPPRPSTSSTSSAALAGPSNLQGSRMARVTSVECFTCHRLFCATCNVRWHGDLSCTQYQKGLLEDKNEEVQFRNLVKVKKWKECAKCKSMIELKEGCIHMTCKCGYQFCYSCGLRWGSSKCQCANQPIFGRFFRP